MSDLFSFVKVYNKPRDERLPGEVPYYHTVISHCGHPTHHENKDGVICEETLYVNGLVKCPKCRALYIR